MLVGDNSNKENIKGEMESKWQAALQQLRRGGGGGHGAVDAANIMLAQLKSQQPVKSSFF